MAQRRWRRPVAALAAAMLGPGALVVMSVPVATARSCTVAGVVATWPLHRLAEQTVVVPVQETDVAAVSDEVAAGAGGVILFGSTAPADLGADLAELTSQAPHGLVPLVMTDEEGGSVQRMANLVGSLPSARRMGATMTPRQIRHLARRVGDRMHAAGITMDLAPVLDLDAGKGPNASDPIGTRSFSLRAATTTADGLAFATGMLRAGVLPVVKHFPGLGQATANTDLRPAWTRRWRYLRHHGLKPFVSAVGAGLPAVMVTNARVPGLTTLPASLSHPAIRRVLRGRLGFHGLVLTDSLSAGAVGAAGYHVPGAAVRALQAGADMVLYGADSSTVAGLTRRTVHAIAGAVRSGTLSEARLRAAVVHVVEAKRAPLCG